MKWQRAAGGGLVLAVALAAGSASAQTAADSDLLIPGGVERLARVLGLDPATAIAPRLIVEAARLAYTVPDGQTENVRAVSTLQRYFDAIDAIAAANGQLSPRALTAGNGKREPVSLEPFGLTVAGDPPRVTAGAGPAAEIRRDLLARAEIDVTAIADALNRGETVTLALDTDRVPLPLGARAWRRLLPKRVADRPLHRAILEDRHACLLYAGLAALDPETLDAIAALQNGGRDLYERAPPFAGQSRGLRIRRGAVVPPGGPEAAALWESVIGVSLNDPGQVIRRLYGGEGRLGYLFDTIAALDAPHQRYALGLWIANGADRLDRFRRLAGLVNGYDESWRARLTPFARPPLDPALFLRSVAVAEDGRPAFPASRAFWSAVFGEPSLDDSHRYDSTDRTDADASWLLDRALDAPIAARRPRAEQAYFVTRLVGYGITDEDTLVRAAHGFARFPSLMLTLDRLRVGEGALYVDAARRAADIDALDGSAAVTALTLFQGSLALIDRIRFARTISVDAAAALVRSLVALDVSDDGYEGAVARWFDESLLPAVARGGGATDADALLTRALAGVSPDPPIVVTWEDVRYRVDLAASELARLTRLRRAQKLRSIAAILRFARAAAGAPPAGAAIPGALGSAFDAVAADPEAPSFHGLRDAFDDARDVIRGGRLQARDRARFVRLGDRLLAYSVMMLVYATSLGDADADPTTVFDPELGDRHDFAKASAVAWQIPHEESGAGRAWHLRGSLLGLDIGLARYALRRLSTEPPMQAPRISSNDRQGFAEAVALMNPYDLTDADAGEIAAAIARGRERLAHLDRATLDEVAAEARLGAWQREAIRWTLDANPAAAAPLFSLADLFWLGRPAASLLTRLDAWGLSARPLDGSLMTRFPRPAEWETFCGRPSLGLLATRTPEMTLRVATALVELRLPASLTRGVVAAATLDMLDDAPLGHRDDRSAVARYAEVVPLARIQDYVSLLTAAGPLMPLPNRRGGRAFR